MNIANLVTCSRVLMIPVVVALYYSPISHSNLYAAVVFAIASITDWLDGYLARKLNQTSPFGAFLDPVADKLLVVMALVLLTANYTSPWFVVPTAVIIAREVFVSALREWMANCNQRNLVAVGYIGKVKTTVQMIAITLLIGVDVQSPQILVQLGYALIYLSAVFSMWSMITYLRAALPTLKMK
ncbi:MAG: CDP-diacylglycerol--glycerol-3-phosphate 3-phosphatidyltransferase [Gammaproteobacteria bacterium RIFCSPLOWO2_02_FULL_57_10]|nr:MAG: CDP-diacylglycerol--glycerol-3-phosphate 3-phosphatidyltransferase [Gammaproteobacteria bacterium RIFCSPLOWO2_02_FULL_57_10]